VRSLGGLWILAEGQGEMPGCGAATTVLTLGYDPQKQAVRGHVDRVDDDPPLDIRRCAGRGREGANA
jgi:Protein of unknown function (DUF1579)